MIWTVGTVQESKSGVMVITDRPPVENLSTEVVVGWKDCRSITEQQRKYAWALVGQIGDWVGTIRQKRKQLNASLKIKFLVENANELTTEAIKHFSLSDCDESTARMYIDFLIDFILEHNIGTKCNLSEMAGDIEKYIYSCLMHKRCCVCGKKADLHHVDRVGMGRNRDEIIHQGLQVLPLCREHHTQCHTMSQEEFNKRYHIPGGLTADKKICKTYGLKNTEDDK